MSVPRRAEAHDGVNGSTPCCGVVFSLTPLLGFGIPGFRPLVLVVIVLMVLYGRSGSRVLLATRYGRAATPWWLRLLSPTVSRPRSSASASRPRGDSRGPSPFEPVAARPQGRLFWALVATAATAVAASIATRMVIHYAASGPH